MEWEEDVMAWLDKYGCLLDPCEEISMMALATGYGDSQFAGH